MSRIVGFAAAASLALILPAHAADLRSQVEQYRRSHEAAIVAEIDAPDAAQEHRRPTRLALMPPPRRSSPPLKTPRLYGIRARPPAARAFRPWYSDRSRRPTPSARWCSTHTTTASR